MLTSTKRSTRRAKLQLLKTIDSRLAFWEEFYKKLACKRPRIGGDNMPDIARWVLCEELRREFAELAKPKALKE